MDATSINTPAGLMAVWYILRTKVEQLHSDFVNIWENN